MSINGLVVLAVPSRMTWDDWAARVKNVATMKKKLYFYIGDLVLYGEATFGEKASQMLNEFGYTNEQLSNFRWVSKKFPPEERCDLPWSLHQAAAALPKRERDKAISAALAGEMNRQGIREMVRATKNGTKPTSAASSENGSARFPSAKEAAFEAFGLAMAECAKLMRHGFPGELAVGDIMDLEEALDVLVEKAKRLRDVLV